MIPKLQAVVSIKQNNKPEPVSDLKNTADAFAQSSMTVSWRADASLV